MKIHVLIAFVTVVWASGLSSIAVAENTTVDPSADWGMHNPLKNCTPCHGNKPDTGSSDKVKLVSPAPQLCYTCHKEYATTDEWKHGPVAAGGCLICHQPHQAKYKSLLVKAVPNLCYYCHDSKSLSQITWHADQSQKSCTDCHEAHFSPGRMLLKKAYLTSDQGKAYMSKNSTALPRPTFVDSRGSLGGLEGVRVVPVLNGSKTLKSYGLTEQFVRKKVEQHLQHYGIKILSEKEHNERESTLHVQVRLIEVPSMRRPGLVDAVSGSIDIYLQQAVELLGTDRDGRKRFCTATTWSTGAIAIWGATQVEKGFDEATKVLMDRFGKDYLDANPTDSNPTLKVKTSSTQL